jgi:hypothetical protein
VTDDDDDDDDENAQDVEYSECYELHLCLKSLCVFFLGFDIWALRKIFGSKREEVRGDWRKLHSEELRESYSAPNIIKVMNQKMRWTRHVWGRTEIHTGL